MSELRSALSELKQAIRENTSINYKDHMFVMNAIDELIEDTLNWEKAQQAAVPTGYELVPVEPTDEYINAMKSTRRQFSTDAATKMYKAVIRKAHEKDPWAGLVEVGKELGDRGND